MIYVDELAEWDDRPFGWREWCHMWTDGPIEELHEFAESIDLARRWFQDHGYLPHYDLTKGKRYHALQMGATKMSLLNWFAQQGLGK